VQLGVVTDQPALGLVAVPVVVVHDPDVDLALVDGLHHRGVAGEHLGVALETGQPRAGRLLALEREDGADDGLEVRASGGDADPALPLGRRQVEDRRGQLRLGDVGRVVGEHRRARGEPDPGAGRGPVLLPHLLEGRLVQRRQQTGLVDDVDRRAVLGEEDVGRRGLVLLDDLVGQLGVVRVAELQLDAGLVGEALEHRADQALVLRAVDGQRRGVRRLRAAARRECAHHAGRGEQSGERPAGPGHVVVPPASVLRGHRRPRA
jgi:hypothetical protein